jgi:L-phenylalanine/L-methionine N-acetyltransferase
MTSKRSGGSTRTSPRTAERSGFPILAEIVNLADKWLNVFRLELTVYATNERAIALYRKFGFETEGTHKAYALRDGRYVDSYSMARLRPKNAAV